jgi:hypothetical protein
VRIRNLLARIAGRAVERPTPVIVGAVQVPNLRGLTPADLRLLFTRPSA